MRYQILEAASAPALADLVARNIRDGWIPVGGVAVVNSHANQYAWWFYQAMTQESPRRPGAPVRAAQYACTCSFASGVDSLFCREPQQGGHGGILNC